MESKIKRIEKGFGKMYFVYSKNGKVFEQNCIGIKELSKFLNRSEQSVWGSISRLKKGKLKHIRNSNGDYFTIISEDDFRLGK